MSDVFKFKGPMCRRELVLMSWDPKGLVGDPATLSDIKAALAERGLCVVARVGAEPTDEELVGIELDGLGQGDDHNRREARRALYRAGQHSRDEEIARLMARVVELEASRERILERTSTDILDLDEAAEDRAERIAELEAQLTAEQQRRQEVERRECLDHQEIAEALGILEQLPDQAGVVAEIVRLRAELASLRKVVEHLTGIVARLGDWSVRYGSDLVPPGRDTYGEGVRACKVHVRGILASASNEAIGEDGSAVERDDETVRGFDSRSAHPVASLDESSPVAEPSKPANPGELSANPPNHPAESSNPSKSSNGSTEPAATVPRGEVEALLRRVAAIPCRCYERIGDDGRCIWEHERDETEGMVKVGRHYYPPEMYERLSAKADGGGNG